MAGQLIFYTNPMSRGQIARWALEEAGADYEQRLLDYGSTMKDDAYLAVNPMGKVPAIVHNGHVVTEAAAICAYLADAFPDANLRPDADALADYYRWLFFASGPVETAMTNHYFKWDPNAEQQRMVGYGDFDRVLDALEGALKDRAYVAGDRFSAADVYVGSQLDWGMQFKMIPARPAFEAYVAGLRERPAYKRAKYIDNALIAEMQKDQPAAG